MPGPTLTHQEVTGELASRLSKFLGQNPFGEILYRCAVRWNDTVVVPDILFVAGDRLDIIGEDVQGAPDLIIEVTSNTSAADYDRKKKDRLYFVNGVKILASRPRRQAGGSLCLYRRKPEPLRIRPGGRSFHNAYTRAKDTAAGCLPAKRLIHDP